ncbi:hypothetical protein [Dysgonomonas reticulitermitis]
MKKHLSMLISIVCCISCISQKKDVITRSTIKLEGENTAIRNLIEVDGYYLISDKLRYGACMFFDDGTWVQFPFKSNISEKETKTNMIRSVQSCIDDRQFRWGDLWGVYKINNDTIIVHSYDKPGTLSILKGMSTDEIRYKIIDRNTIQKIYFRINSKAGDQYYRETKKNLWRNEAPMNFIPADSLPSSDNWLKENKWIWRNESDWKEYKKKIEQKKKANNH